MRSYRDHLILSGCSIKEALIKLEFLSSDAILFLVDKDDKLIGSLTDGDVRRALIRDIPVSSTIDEIVQPNPKFFQKGEWDMQKVINYREENFRVIPIIDKNNKIVNVINFREVRSYLPVDVVIMAGGRGQRLQPLTDNIPKPLLKVGKKPIIEHNIDRLALYGVNDFWISINYLGEQIENYFGDGHEKNIQIKYVREDKPLGTIGAVSNIKNFEHDFILLTNSDLLTNLDYEHFFLDFLNQDADLAIATIPYQVNIPYAVLETMNGVVKNFKEKPTYTYYSNGGIYLIKKEVISYLPKDTFFNATDLLEKLIKDGKKIVSYSLSGYWLDIGQHEDFEKAQQDIKHIKF